MSEALQKFELSLNQCVQEAREQVARLDSLELIEKFRIEFFGKKGRFSELMRVLGALGPDEKPEAGKKINVVREELFAVIDQRRSALTEEMWKTRLAKESIDVTLPGREVPHSYIHPVKLAEEEFLRVFGALGFVVEVGPEVEHEFFNFDALNIPRDHPSRTMQDTFYVNQEKGVLLRTQTSPVQIRTMLAGKPPVRIVSPGRVYRADYDATHSPMFHQIEGLWVDRDVSMADLKGVLAMAVKGMFGEELSVRLRPSYFPFTEPSAELDMQCCFCGGAGCGVCKHSGWIEIAGCGMVDPEVFKAVGVDSGSWRGLAFGFGIERIAMLKYGIRDLRSFYESDHRFISQFARWRS